MFLDRRRKLRKALSEYFTRLEADTGDVFYRTDNDTWVCNYGDTRTHIRITPPATDPSDDNWDPEYVTIATEWFDKVTGSPEAENKFLWTIFEWNSEMNAMKIGYQPEVKKLTLNTEHRVDGLEFETVTDSLVFHVKRHKVYLPKVLDLALDLGLYFEPLDV